MPGTHLLAAATVDEWAATVGGLLDSPDRRRRLGAAGRRYVEQEYDWDVVLDRYEHTLDRVAHRAFVRDAAINAG